MEEGRAGRYRIRPKAGNGEIVAVGEAYDTLASAKEGCAAVQRAADGASVVEADSRQPTADSRQPTIVVVAA